MEAVSPMAKTAAPARTAPGTLRLPGSMTYTDWASAGRQLAWLSHGVAWALGDWLLYGQAHFGSRYREAIAATGLDHQTLRNYAWVARSVAPSRRRERLSFQHHAEVAALSEAEQELWLARAERLRWSRNQLRRELAERRRGLGAGPAHREIVLRLDLTAMREDRWRTAARAARQDLGEWLSAVADEAADAVLH